jgi:hypothetical protein
LIKLLRDQLEDKGRSLLRIRRRELGPISFAVIQGRSEMEEGEVSIVKDKR